MTRFVKGNIKVLLVPDGDAPEWVRRAWVDVVLPVRAVEGNEYLVDQMLAICALGLQSKHDSIKEVLNWWKGEGHPIPGHHFCFDESEVEIVGKLEDMTTHLRVFAGILEVGVGAHDHPENQ